MKKIDISDIKDFYVGNFENKTAATGCTAILCPYGAQGGVDVRGGGPASRETALLRTDKMIERIHCVMLSGGSAFGLDAASGAMQFLEEKGIGFDTGAGVVPIVCAASLFDLTVGSCDIRPDKTMGYNACLKAMNRNFKEGNYGAGTGATVGKYKGSEYSVKSGIGSAAYIYENIEIGAVVAVNALGDIKKDGVIIAGMLNGSKDGFQNTEQTLLEDLIKPKNVFKGNTTIGCIITNAKLTKAETNKLASISHNALARAISPVHTSFDGDTLFALSSGKTECFFDALCILAQKVTEEAIINAVLKAESAYGFPCVSELKIKPR